tara:strand:- start:19 stop:255 length:237 start_codon:yes stop_codon:yes gene_type:complete
MRHGEVYKKNSVWWFSKRTDNSTLVLSTKHKTKATALSEAQKELYKGYIDNLHTWKSNGSYESCMAICKAKENNHDDT